MAIAFVSAGAGSETSMAWGAGHAIGDIGIAFCQHGNNSASIATPTGFTPFIGPLFGANNCALTGFWKIATSTSEAAAALDFNVGGTQNNKWGGICVWTGVNTATPIDYLSTGIWPVAATVSYCPSTQTLVNGCMIVGVSTWTNDDAGPLLTSVTNANLGSVSERFDSGEITGSGGGLAVVDGTLATLGSSGRFELTWSTTIIGVAATFALIPAGVSLTTLRHDSRMVNGNYRR